MRLKVERHSIDESRLQCTNQSSDAVLRQCCDERSTPRRESEEVPRAGPDTEQAAWHAHERAPITCQPIAANQRGRHQARKLTWHAHERAPITLPTSHNLRSGNITGTHLIQVQQAQRQPRVSHLTSHASSAPGPVVVCGPAHVTICAHLPCAHVPDSAPPVPPETVCFASAKTNSLR